MRKRDKKTKMRIPKKKKTWLRSKTLGFPRSARGFCGSLKFLDNDLL
jgi:hypothetical protein